MVLLHILDAFYVLFNLNVFCSQYVLKMIIVISSKARLLKAKP